MLAMARGTAAYPNARIVVVQRDPIRTVASSASLSVTAKPHTLTCADVRSYFGSLWLEKQA
jgi:hypothetical protein